jgi:hypothetical protein
MFTEVYRFRPSRLFSVIEKLRTSPEWGAGPTGNDHALGAGVDCGEDAYVAAGTTGGLDGKRMMRSGFCEVEFIAFAACSSWDRSRLSRSNYRDKS